MCKEAVIDNDFIEHLLQTDWPDEDGGIASLVKDFFQDLQLKPIMHELVYEYELMDVSTPQEIKDTAGDFFDTGVVVKKDICAFLPDCTAKRYYEKVFREIYHDFKGDVPIGDILGEWKRKCSLGEVHSTTMCVILECDVFLSDDDDSCKLQRIVKEKFSFDIQVQNRRAACDAIRKRGEKTLLNKKKRRALAHLAR